MALALVDDRPAEVIPVDFRAKRRTDRVPVARLVLRPLHPSMLDPDPKDVA